MATLGKYTLVRKLAAGGMAEVFLARTDGPAGFSKTQVIKRILPHLSDNEEFVAMFLNEARLAAVLNHPNIIQIFELGKEGGHYFLAMELVDGAHLRALARAAHAKGEHLPLNEVLKIISLACEGLAYAHEFVDDTGKALELVHRDISPDNLLISRQGAVKVADFGIAKAANLPNLTKTGILKGKINYMPPEQLRAIPLDRRADVFALGVVLHEALASTKPFDSSSDISAMQAILNEAPRRLAELRPDLPDDVQVIIDKALAKNRDERYADCRAMQSDIDALLLKLQASVRASDIAKLVNTHIPVPLRSSDPNLKAVPSLVGGVEKAGTPANGTPVEEELLELSPSQVIDTGAAPKTAATRTGPKPMLVEAPDPVAFGVADTLPQTNAIPQGREPGVVELRGGRPPERARPPPSSKLGVVAGVGIGLAAIAGWAVWGRSPPAAAPSPTEKPTIAETPPTPAPPAVVVPSPAPQAVVAVPAPTPAVAAPPPTPQAVAALPVSTPKPEPVLAAVAEPARPRHHHPQATPPAPTPSPSPTPSSAPVVTPAPEAAPTVAAKKVVINRDDSGPATGPKSSSTEPGTLVLRVAPWAEVEIDGTSYGVTPMAPVKLMPGSHQVRLKNTELQANRQLKVDIQPGAPSTLRVNLGVPP